MAKQNYFYKPTEILKLIYKASQCADLNDCEIAIEMLQNKMTEIRQAGYSVHRSLYMRLISLEKKYKKLYNAI